MQIHIIGCGTIGSNLAISLCKNPKITSLYLYDNDVVTYSNVPEFPYQQSVMGLPKVEALTTIIHGLGLKTKIYQYQVKVVNDIRTDGIILDCRDDKTIPLICNIRLSLDGPVLIIDNRIGRYSVDDYNDYIYEKDSSYIDLGISIITRFICGDFYKTEGHLIYDLRSIVLSGMKLE